MTYNIVKDYDWTSIPRGSPLRGEAPVVYLKSYKLKSNQIQSTIQSYLNIGGTSFSNAESFYEKMYSRSTTKEDIFNIPFFGDSVRSFSNSFSESFKNGYGESGGAVGEGRLRDKGETLLGKYGEYKNLVDNIGWKDVVDKAFKLQFFEAAKAIVKGDGDAPGTYIEKPQFYDYAKTDGPLEVSFTLSNTINSDWSKNTELVKLLTKINRPLRKNSVAVEPPRIYSVKVPGHRYIKWAFCSNFSVELVGTRRMISGTIAPEAYKINMSFQSLTLEHAGFMDKVK
jgi:hypothetical protein